MKSSMVTRIFTYVFISTAFLLVISVFTMKFSLWNAIVYIESFSTFDILLSQIANTLLVLSLTSVLSTNIGSVYWVDIKDVKLVNPFFSCFLALTTYLISAMVFSLVSYSLNYHEGVCTSFVFSITLLIFLTYKMIGAYFGRNDIKKQLRWQYQQAMLESEYSYYRCEKMLKLLADTMNSNSFKYTRKQKLYVESKLEWFNKIEFDGFSKHVSDEKKLYFDDITMKLKEKTLQALNNNDFTTIQENIELLLAVNDNNNFMNILDSIVAVNPEYAASLLLKAKDMLGVTYQAQISDTAKNILHNMSENTYSYRTIRKLLWAISGNEQEVEQYKTFMELICQKAKHYQRELLTLSQKVTESTNEDFRHMIREEKQFNLENAKIFWGIFQEYDGIVMGTSYKPIYELYDAYVKKDLNLVSFYLKIMEHDYQEIKMELPNELDIIKKYHLTNNDIQFLYISKSDSEIVDLIIEREKTHNFLPKQVLIRITNLLYIRL